MTQTLEKHRPTSITVIVALMWVSAIIGLIAGIVLLIERNDNDFLAAIDETTGHITTTAVIGIVMAVVTAVLAHLLSQGSNVVRWIVGIVMLFWFAAGIYALFVFDGEYRTEGILQAAIAGVVLYFLFGSEESNEFFV